MHTSPITLRYIIFSLLYMLIYCVYPARFFVLYQVALQRQLWSHSKWIDPELLASVAARAECPKPPTPPPQSNSSLLEQTPSFTTTCLPSPVPAVESRNAALAPLVPPSSASSPEAATRTSEPAENESTTADSVIIEDMVPPTLPSV
jgi:hypothetical protein